MSFLGLDIGQKRIGMAIGDVIAEEYETIEVANPAKSFLDQNIGTTQAIEKLRAVINSQMIEKVIVGLPFNEDGSPSPMSEKILQFSELLGQSADVPIETVDELLTSFAAEEMLKEEGLTIKEAKTRVDQLSAKLILQQYLEEL